MELLGRKVKEGDAVINKKTLKVDEFLNHQIDAELMSDVDKTFYESFKDTGITKILTIEAPGIVPVTVASSHFDVPCLPAKKAKPSTLKDDPYSTDIHLFIKNKTSTVIMPEEFLGTDDKVPIIDDFLANGDTPLGLNSTVKQINTTMVGVSTVAERNFQDSRQHLKDADSYVSSLCKVVSLKGNGVTLLGEA